MGWVFPEPAAPAAGNNSRLGGGGGETTVRSRSDACFFCLLRCLNSVKLCGSLYYVFSFFKASFKKELNLKITMQHVKKRLVGI